MIDVSEEKVIQEASVEKVIIDVSSGMVDNRCLIG